VIRASEAIAEGGHGWVILTGPGTMGEEDPDRARAGGESGHLSFRPGDCRLPAHLVTVERRLPFAPMELVVYDSAEEATVGAAERIADLMAQTDEGFTIGLAGGSTPAAIYGALRGRATGWHRVDAWLSDERWVPPDDKRSNGRMASEILMDHVEARFHRPRWSEFIEAPDSAAHYEADIRSIHNEKRPDLVLLGMGEDGHTASLFPASSALDEAERWFVANTIPETGEERLTATYPLLWRARMLLVTATGEKKAPALRDSFAGGSTPIARIGDGDAEVEWHVDRPAASLLS